ncbi:hypothetical protein PENTCL1PPCAC_15036, partial [Pristionchus entomophagus]
KRFKSGEESPTHINKGGFSLSKNKVDRQFEMTQATLFTSLDILYSEMEKLQSQMVAITKAITDLASTIPTLIQSQIDGVTHQDGCQRDHQVGFNGPTPQEPGFCQKPSIGQERHRVDQGDLREDRRSLIPSEGKGRAPSPHSQEREQCPLPLSPRPSQLLSRGGEDLQGCLGRGLQPQRRFRPQGVCGPESKG